MGKNVWLSLLVAAALLTLTGCRVSEATAVQEVVEPTQPEPTDSPVPEEPTVQAEETPVAVFGQVGYIPGAFPTMGGDTWEFTDMQSESCGGGIDTSLMKQERFTPLSEGGCLVSILAEGANDTTFYLVPRLDQAQYRKPDETVGTAKYNPDMSEVLVPVYMDGNQVIYRQPGIMVNYRDGTVPLLGREDATGDVWVFYVGNDGSIIRRAPVFFGPEDSVQVTDGKVLVNGQVMRIDIETQSWVESPFAELTLADGYEIVRDEESFVLTYQGDPLFQIRKSGLTPRTLSNDREVLTGLELVEETQLADQLPTGSQIVLDSEGYPTVLLQGRIVGVFFEGNLLMMPGLERWGAEEIQVAVVERTPKVTSLRGTVLYAYQNGEWESVIGPDEVTDFIFFVRPVTTSHLVVAPPSFRTPSYNVGELEKIAEVVVKVENPEPYTYNDPLWGPRFDVMIVEGAMWSPDGHPSLVKVVIAFSFEFSENITYLQRTNMTEGGSKGLTLSQDEFIQLLSEKRYAYVYLHFGLNEEKVPQQYSDHPVYVRYRHLESSGVLDFLEDPSETSPYSLPLLVSAFTLSGEEEQ